MNNVYINIIFVLACMAAIVVTDDYLWTGISIILFVWGVGKLTKHIY